jgi:hypothetical protein
VPGPDVGCCAIEEEEEEEEEKKEKKRMCQNIFFPLPMLFNTCSPQVNKLFLFPEKKVLAVAIHAYIKSVRGHWQIDGFLKFLSEPEVTGF